ncbi:xanthine dehydrogenase family protein molybdopterin-binding subunit [Pseudonocardia sp. DSM 110487]|uniref:xanthine dehydrogenase family protein molybdopterin-binding subunit n=1 Tax=Pseudonocardia sp. DSM 110487 TaxID=2865833 RepID=UPI001C6A2F49|nr:xanthine dehydrogenase family protein molybdopterin-binding subunit [Pseudonocardia sp. DSM 110487]QYN33922.1 xanthine dehydrogenase family protein molybdopterin-binding subunit [Pseudonocardia sp. DSM 110487]
MTTPLGSDVARVDGRLKVTGAARYSADHSEDHWAGRLAYAHVVLSTVARGSVRSMNVDAARGAPGVLAVYTPFEPLRIYSASRGETYAPLQDRDVRFRGQVIGLVVAETIEQAREAAALVSAEYDTVPARTTIAAGMPGEPVGGDAEFPAAAAPLLAPGVASIEDALRASAVTVDTTVTQQPQSHVAMEPHSTTAVWQNDHLTVYSGCQGPANYANTLAERVGVSRENVRVISPFVGGGFGSRVPTWGDGPLAAVAARALGRPVKLTLAREQAIVLTGHRPLIEQRVRLGASRDGVLNAVSHECHSEMPVAGGWNEAPAGETTTVLYRTPNLAIEERLVPMDTPATWAMRAPNEAPGMFALETAMDELAVALGMDPVELRLRNDATTVPGTDRGWTSRRLAECYRVGAERFGWADRNPVPGSRIDGEWLVGHGTATAIYPANRSDVPVRMTLRDDGTAVVSTSTPDIGTGTYTMASIVASDALGIPLDRVVAELGDSALPAGTAAVGSRAAGTLAPMIQDAARTLIGEITALAVRTERSPFHGLDPASLTYREGRVEGNGRSATFAEIIDMADLPHIEVTTEGGAGGPGGGGAPEGPVAHGFGAHFCEVRVNRFTGEPRVSRFTTVVDVGQVISARTARSQLVGGVVFGIGGALLETNPFEADTGRFACGNLADYLVAVNADIPSIDVSWIDYADTAFSSAGARGLGELATVGSSAAVGNAVFNATGIRVRDLPITLDKLIT